MTDVEMPDMFDRLTEQVQRWAEEYPEPPAFVLTSDKELSGTDPAGHVEVTMRDFAVASVHIDDAWFADYLPSLMQIEQAVKAATNTVLADYWAQELQDAKDHRTPMGEIAAGLEELSVGFRAAFENAVARLDAHDE
jgi:hypothetical protein